MDESKALYFQICGLILLDYLTIAQIIGWASKDKLIKKIIKNPNSKKWALRKINKIFESPFSDCREQVKMANGRDAVKGTCSKCGTKMFKIGKME